MHAWPKPLRVHSISLALVSELDRLGHAVEGQGSIALSGVALMLSKVVLQGLGFEAAAPAKSSVGMGYPNRKCAMSVILQVSSPRSQAKFLLLSA